MVLTIPILLQKYQQIVLKASNVADFSTILILINYLLRGMTFLLYGLGSSYVFRFLCKFYTRLPCIFKIYL